MKAVMAFGPDDLRVAELPVPQPGAGEVLVQVEYGGVCGSDLHYWKQGAVGTSVLREPMVLGHEVAGRVADVGSGVTGHRTGEAVTIHPGRPCLACRDCAERRTHLCPDLTYMGSAARTPHTAGAFAQYVTVAADQLRALPRGLSTRTAALAEPLGVALHAVNRAGDLRGRTVLVNGAGPIGCLVVAAARHAGAEHIWAGDLAGHALKLARAVGADEGVDVTTDALPSDVDVVFEASGAPVALAGCVAAVRKGGTLVQVGMLPPGEMSTELAPLVTKEVDYLGSFRFVDEITDAVRLLDHGIDAEPLLTHTFGVDDVTVAFTTALDRSVAGKVLLSFR